MPNTCNEVCTWLRPKERNRNYISATFHLISITLVSISMTDLSWFTITGNGICSLYINIAQFSNSYELSEIELSCLSPLVINCIRFVIVLCLLVIFCSFTGFLLDIFSPQHKALKLFHKYAIPGVNSVLLIILIVAMSYFIVLQLDSLENSQVEYGPGFYLVSFAGFVSLMGIYYTLNLGQESRYFFRDDDRCLIDAFDDGLHTFEYTPPPPPYNIPPPPYSP